MTGLEFLAPWSNIATWGIQKSPPCCFGHLTSQPNHMSSPKESANAQIHTLLWVAQHWQQYLLPKGAWTGNWKEFQHFLVGGWPTPLKNMSSSVGMIIPNLWKNKCSKPPSSISAIGSASLNPLQSCQSGIIRSNQAISVATPPVGLRFAAFPKSFSLGKIIWDTWSWS